MAERGTERPRTDSPISRRIVLAFLDFLSTVEPAADVDIEGLDVVRECLEEAFKLNQSPADDKIPHGLMIDLFRSYDKQCESKRILDTEAASIESSQKAASDDVTEASERKDQHADTQFVEVSRDELFGQFYAALDKANFFTTTPGGDEDHAQLAKATHFFEDALLLPLVQDHPTWKETPAALKGLHHGLSVTLIASASPFLCKRDFYAQLDDTSNKLRNSCTQLHDAPAKGSGSTDSSVLSMTSFQVIWCQWECNGFSGWIDKDLEKSGGQKLSRVNLAETLKSQGNRAMQSKLYTEAIELYTCAVALLENNAIFYCNRAAAYTQIHKYTEAIADCMKSIELDPNYAKAYSRLGLAYYAQGKYQEALLVFYKALQLDPNNDSVRENIRVAEQKWREESRRTGPEQSTGSSQDQQTNTRTTGPRSNHIPFTSIPISAALPADFANFFMSMASATGASHSQEQNTQSPESRNEGASYTSIPIGASLPSDFARVFMNMSSPHGQAAHDQTANGNVGGSNQPEIRIDGNINLNLEEVPELSGALRSVMDMFTQHGRQERTSEGAE